MISAENVLYAWVAMYKKARIYIQEQLLIDQQDKPKKDNISMKFLFSLICRDEIRRLYTVTTAGAS